MGKNRNIFVGTFFVLLLGLFHVPTVTADHHNSKSPHEVKVMTFNLYLGVDISPLFAAGSPQEIPLLVADKFSVLQSTNFPERAKAIAKKIANKKPDLIGLQEVSLIRIQSRSYRKKLGLKPLTHSAQKGEELTSSLTLNKSSTS